MVKEDLKKWKEFQQRKKQNVIERDGIELICRLHSEIFNHKYYEPCTCRKKEWQEWISEINKHIIDQYANKQKQMGL